MCACLGATLSEEKMKYFHAPKNTVSPLREERKPFDTSHKMRTYTTTNGDKCPPTSHPVSGLMFSSSPLKKLGAFLRSFLIRIALPFGPGHPFSLFGEILKLQQGTNARRHPTLLTPKKSPPLHLSNLSIVFLKRAFSGVFQGSSPRVSCASRKRRSSKSVACLLEDRGSHTEMSSVVLSGVQA